MQVISFELTSENMGRTNAQKQAAYRQRNPRQCRRDAARKRTIRATALPEFIGVDGEGIRKGKARPYVLLGVGDQQYENPNGIQWEEAFSFLYQQYEAHPNASFVGFYLRYDFDKILSTLPQYHAALLLTKRGKATRKKPEYRGQRNAYYPVRLDGWEFDVLGMKRLSIRPIVEGCKCGTKGIKCPLASTNKHAGWMHICDAGPFFQMKFEDVINPATWLKDPDGPVCTKAQSDRISTGKGKRATATRITEEMRRYNIEENIILATVMTRLAKGYHSVGIRPAKDQWYGPGVTAARWLDKHDVPKRKALRMRDGDRPPLIPKVFWEACRRSYFGGWFEIFSHGIIKGQSYNYDINNAYPFAATKLPHICGECKYTGGTGHCTSKGEYVLLYCTVYSKGTRIGAMPHRNKAGNILRPSVTKGWYWRFELDAARRAGLVKRVVTHEWKEFIPCQHPKPLTEVRDLYYLRLNKGKESALGMAIKNNNNSIYGKFAQGTGGKPYNNWFYASFITAHCRAQILDAIASHPDKADAVLMVATDGICFDSPNPTLDGITSTELGEWTATTYTDLLLFKPGVYTHKEGIDALMKVKSRGVPKDEFKKQVDKMYDAFQHFLDIEMWPGYDAREFIEENLAMADNEPDWKAYKQREDEYYATRYWPRFVVYVNFRMKSCLQALNEGKWERAGQIQDHFPLWQDSNPYTKRDHLHGMSFNHDKRRIDSSIHTLEKDDIETHYHGEVKHEKHLSLGVGLDGDAMGPVLEAFTVLRNKPANYDLPIDDTDIQWERVWG